MVEEADQEMRRDAVLESIGHLAWRFHWHGIASGGKHAALNALRDTPAFEGHKRQPGEPKPDVALRMRIARRPLYNLPHPLTYCIKPWRARWTRDDGSRGRPLRLLHKARVQALLWQHRWSLPDTSLLMGIRPGHNGFIPLDSTRVREGEA